MDIDFDRVFCPTKEELEKTRQLSLNLCEEEKEREKGKCGSCIHLKYFQSVPMLPEDYYKCELTSKLRKRDDKICDRFDERDYEKDVNDFFDLCAERGERYMRKERKDDDRK